MESLKLFRNDFFGDILVIVKNNKEYFDANSVANVLGYSNPRDAIIRHCKEEGIIIHEVGVTSKTRNGVSLKTQMYKKKFIDEGNLYRLIMKSKLKSACKFERWVCDEVIPSIRKHGAYIDKNLIDEMLENPDLIISLAQRLKNERLKVKALNKVIIENEEYINLGKTIEDTEGAITIGQYAKIIELQSALGIPQTGQWDTLTIAKVASLTPLSTSNSYPREVTRWIQRRVGVTADGWYGDNTANAVYNWQANHGLGRDGVSGIETIQSLALA